jgi:UDP-N-acetylglucosamine 2-epimerase (non-hydrolysing)
MTEKTPVVAACIPAFNEEAIIARVVLTAERYMDQVLVCDDGSTDMTGVIVKALVAAKLHIPVGHVKAGLRSFDRSMPEEINRVVMGHVSDYLFAPTPIVKENLMREGVSAERMDVTENIVVDAVNQNGARVRG